MSSSSSSSSLSLFLTRENLNGDNDDVITCRSGQENIVSLKDEKLNQQQKEKLKVNVNVIGNKSCPSCECAICYANIEKQCIVLDCLHPFHKKCLQEWIQSTVPLKRTCPSCRQEMKNYQIEYILKDWDLLFNSALLNFDEDLMILLIKRGVDIEILKKENEDGWLVMNLIISWKLNRFIDILCRKNLITSDDINKKQTFSGFSALHVAAMYNNFTACSILLNHGADINVKSNNLLTPLVFAVYEESIETLNVLLDRGADPNIPNKDNNTCLFLKMNLETCRLLLDHGANVNFKNDKGNTPLHYVIGYFNQEDKDKKNQENLDKYLSIMKLLLDRGASINARNDLGETPYMIALKNGLTSVCELLVSRGAIQEEERKERKEREEVERVGEKRPRRDDNDENGNGDRDNSRFDRMFFYCFF